MSEGASCHRRVEKQDTLQSDDGLWGGTELDLSA